MKLAKSGMYSTLNLFILKNWMFDCYYKSGKYYQSVAKISKFKHTDDFIIIYTLGIKSEFLNIFCI